VLKAVGSLHNKPAAASAAGGFPVGGGGSSEASSKGRGKGKVADKGPRQSQREKERALTSIMSPENAAVGQDASIFELPSLNETMSTLFEIHSEDDSTGESGPPTPKKAAKPKQASSRARMSLRPTSADLPAGWMQAKDPASGRPYYYDGKGNTQWHRPQAPREVPTELPLQPQTTNMAKQLPSESAAVSSTSGNADVAVPTTQDASAADTLATDSAPVTTGSEGAVPTTAEACAAADSLTCDSAGVSGGNEAVVASEAAPAADAVASDSAAVSTGGGGDTLTRRDEAERADALDEAPVQEM